MTEKTEAQKGFDLNARAQFLGFDNINELNRMVIQVDLTSMEKIKAFKEWQENDGTKEGLEKLLGK